MFGICLRNDGDLQAMESCPRKDVGDPKIAFVEENFYLFTEVKFLIRMFVIHGWTLQNSEEIEVNFLK